MWRNDDTRTRWKAWNDNNHEAKSLDTISIKGVKFPCVKKYDTGTIKDEENYFSVRELFRYIVNDTERMCAIMEPLGYAKDERSGAMLGLLNELARYYHTDIYTYSQIKKDVGADIPYLDNDVRDILKNIRNDKEV